MSSPTVRDSPIDIRDPLSGGVATSQASAHSGTITKSRTANDLSSGFAVESSAPKRPNEFIQALKTRGGFVKHYEIIRNLDEGGMGVIFLARDTKLGRLVAIKLLKDSSRGTSRFIEEAQTTAGIKHENVVTIYDIDEFEDHLYLVLEYVEGRTLRQMLAEHAANQRPIAKGLAISIITQVVRGLEAAHDRGIVHRDLKPENVMLLDSGQVKILDFGIAMRIDQATDERIGTRRYMSPEQWLGTDVNIRTDIWAVGLIFFELLAGQHPLEYLSSASTARSIVDVNEPIPHLTDLRSNLHDLEPIVDRCLQRRAEARFSTASELLEALGSVSPQVAKDIRVEVAPFAGLSAFQEKDARRFFGRERDVEMVVGRIDRQCIMTILGPSGAGKSSFVRAGLVPALRLFGEAWDVLMVRPGRSPLNALIEALSLQEPASSLHSQPGLFGSRLRERCQADGQSRRVLLFVDQFEEVFTLVEDKAEREAFLNCLLGSADEASSPVRIVLAVRSDFLDRIAEERSFMDRVLGGLYFLRPMDRDGLREALVRPVEAAGYEFESDEMVDDVLQSLQSTKSPLPLLQFTAARLWDQRDQEAKLLTRRSYEALGGVAGALSTHADALIASLTPHQQRLSRAIFLRLVTPQRTRAIVSTNELLELSNQDPEIMSVVQHLSNARLLLLDVGESESSAMVELVHESLIDRWPKLSRWIEENADDAEFVARLQTATAQWLSSGKRPGLLWRDHVAEEARTWYARRTRQLGTEAHETLGKNELQYLREVISLLERTAKHRRWAIAGAFVAMSVALSSVAYFAVQSQVQAKRADQEARAVREKNVELGREALRGRNATRIMAARKRLDDSTLALALLREIEPAEIPRDWSELVSQALSSGIAKYERILSPDKPSYCVKFSPDGKKIGVGSGDGKVHILDARNLETLTVLPVHEKAVFSITWTPDGKRIITASLDRTAHVTRIDGSDEPIVLRDHTASVHMVSMSKDGERLATASDDGTVRLWQTSTGKSLGIFRAGEEFYSVSLDPTGQRVLGGSGDRQLRLWNSDAPTDPPLVGRVTNLVSEGQFSPDGQRIASYGSDKTLRILDAGNLDEQLVLRGHEGRLTSVTWSHDGRRIATTSKDKTVRIWTLDGSEDPIVLRGHQHWVYSAGFSPDDRSVVTTSLDRSIRLWDLGKIDRPIVLNGSHSTLKYAAMSPDGRRIAATAGDHTLSLWDLEHPDKPLVLSGHTALAEHIAWHPDSRHLATSSEDGTARVWDVDDSSKTVVLNREGSVVKMSSWSHDGQRLATLYTDGVIRFWNAAGTLMAATSRNKGDPISHGAIEFDASDKHVLVYDTRHDSVDITDLDQNFRLRSIGHHSAPVTDAVWRFDGKRIATSSTDRTVSIWDPNGVDPPVVHHEIGPIEHLNWSPDGERLAIQFADAGFVVHPAQTDKNPIFITPPGHRVQRVLWHPDGSRIISTSDDGMVRIWNANGTGQPFVFFQPATMISDIFIGKDGKRIGLRADDYKIYLWPDVLPFTGPDDPRLWNATTYCIPATIRVALLDVEEKQAQEDESRCKQRIETITAATSSP